MRGQRFIVECDHQALKPLFQKQLKGAIYERWIAILQQYNFDLRYKPARDMQVADALSRVPHNNISEGFVSPDMDDPYFPYKTENVGEIPVEGGQHFPKYLHTDSSENEQINNILVDKIIKPNCDLLNPVKNQNMDLTSNYDADTEEYEQYQIPNAKRKFKRKRENPFSARRVKSNSEPHLRNVTTTGVVTDTVTGTVSEESKERPNDKHDQSTTVNTESDARHTDIDVSTVINETYSDIFNQTTDVNTEQDDEVRREIEQISLFDQSDFSAKSIQQLQRKDDEYGKIISYLDNGELPKQQKKARKVLLQSPEYALIDGLLFHSRIAKSERTKNLDNYQLVLPEIAVKTVISMYHDSPLGDHGGIQHTMDLIRENYFFPKLAQKVSDYIKSCHACQSRKLTKVNTRAGIVAYCTPDSPFQVWQIDIYGHLHPVSSTGNQYICTAVDMFSKFIFAEPIPSADTMSVSEVLVKLVSQLGVCRLLDLKQQFTPSFTHHCLGACERSHRTLAERLTPYIANGKSWQDILQCVIFSRNNTVNSSLGYSPFEIVYGRRPNFPLSNHNRNSDLNSLPKDYHD